MVPFILCLLPALLATTNAQAQSTKCLQCSGSADSSCQPAAGTCPVTAGTGGCIKVAEENTLIGEKTTGFARSCLADYNSGINAAITYTAGNGKYLRINTNRCNNADNCNSGTLAVPTVDAAANGLQCPTCFALNSDPCDSQITPCTGDEKYCIDFAGTLTKGSTVSTFVAKGCATASTKDIQPGTSLVSAVYTFMFTKVSSQAAEKITPTTKPPAAATKPTTATTSGASPALGRFSFALYLPGLTGLLLVKLLA
ncbi:phospholipase A2 inhibitor and Ly6/PLAUR domain-containing protein-like [Mauremys mutica]|uniref:phospholipase A2 inhibitor and Ly6/PLAUR domain-containing protein-like n=1 Tax=Mauremys mutica TaxID=74926 RepID=UPI001D16598D|nr:phospholipase A2 inhibitor and Ly6/PLAUR domain-containing protein-like [Mauremys mutica]